jgi:hypothetical protein
MRRSAFGAWGADLDRDDFARALAALGLRPPFYGPTELQAVLATDAPHWYLPSLPPPPELDAFALAREWTDAAHGARRPLRLALGASPDELGSPGWLVRELARAEVGVDGLFVEMPPGQRRGRWSWPLKLALLDGGRSELRARLTNEPGWLVEQFVELVEPEAPDPCDLLLVAGGLRPALAQIVANRLSAGMVAVLAPLAEPWERGRALVDAIMVDAGAGAVAFVPVASQAKEWLDALLWNLSHDSGLDVALLQAARDQKLRTPLLVASRDFLEETRISRLRDRLATRVGAAMREARDVGALAYDVERVRELPLDHEHLAAAETAMVTREVDRLLVAPRFVQAQVYEAEREPTAGEPTVGEPAIARALRTATAHELVVRVGPAEAHWLAAPEAFPEQELPPADEHRLDVVLTAPALLDEPQSAEIVLPERGPSTNCSFRLHAPTREGPFEARIIVLHEGRIVQTALVRGQVSSSPEAVDDDDVLRLETEAQVGSFASLAGRTRFDGALVINRDEAQVKRLTVVAGEQLDIREPRDFDDAIAAISAKLEDAVTAEVAGSLRDESTRELLVFLARHGRTLSDALLDLRGGATLAAAERLQILAADAEAFFPLEFVYDRVAPNDDAELCPNAEQALATGVCYGCPATTDAAFVCPLGFWCLRKVIERHVHDPEAAAAVDGDFRVTMEPADSRRRLRALTSALFAASQRVDDYKAGTIKALAKELGAAVGKAPTHARSWPDWRTGVGSASPPLLVLLPHTEKDQAQLSTLVIEAAEQLAVDRINESYVGEGGPIVLLLGCRTGDTTIPFQRFPAAFRRGGAAIVLATLTKVLGRYAGQVAGQTVSLLAERARERPVTFGEVMRDVRRRLLAAGVPTVLALTAYGDADWVLGPEGS